MTICPNCGNNQLLEVQDQLDNNPPVTWIECASCGARQHTILVLTQEECQLLSKHILLSTFVPRDHYDVVHPIIMKIINFADTGKEN
jgi:hypothetical protein